MWREPDPNRRLPAITTVKREQNPEEPKQEDDIPDFEQKPTETNTISHVDAA
jgi:hypothetical protein